MKTDRYYRFLELVVGFITILFLLLLIIHYKKENREKSIAPKTPSALGGIIF